MISSIPPRSSLVPSAIATISFLLCACMWYACSDEYVPEEFHPTNDHEAYAYSLEQAGLAETALGRDWLEVAHDVLDNPVLSTTPLEEMFYLDPTRADAVAYRFSAMRGHKIQIEMEVLSESAGDLFVDLFRLSEVGSPTHVATSSGHGWLGFEPRKDGDYVLRIQSELLRGGSYSVRIIKVPAFDFPVAGGRTRDIGSFFGDPRDGGRRKHHGVDIFAKKGTPILAPTDGYIRFTGERGLGGLVVWMRDEQRDQTLYFAHLNEIVARRYTYVKTGDTLGTVGNTGNARTTPAHLHFGIYRNGPIDPYHFVAAADDAPDPVDVSDEILSRTMRVARSTTLWPACDEHDGVSLDPHQLVTVRGARGNRLRVDLPDGQSGYVRANAVEFAEEALESRTVAESASLHAVPDDCESPIHTLQSGEEVDILGRNDDFLFVRSVVGHTGWMITR